MRRLLIEVASPAAEHRVQAGWAQWLLLPLQLLHGLWGLPGPGLEPTSPALAGGLLTTEPPGKPLYTVLLRADLWPWQAVNKILLRNEARRGSEVHVLNHQQSLHGQGGAGQVGGR